MPDWRAEIRARLAPLELSTQRETEIVEEWAQHLEDRYADLRARGQSDGDALQVTRAELAAEGFADLAGLSRVAVAGAPLGGEPSSGHFLADLWRDIRFGARSLRRTPGFTILAALTLALGIGATTAMFGVLNAVLLRPLPFPHPENLVRLYQTYEKAPGGVGSFSLADFLQVRDDGRAYLVRRDEYDATGRVLHPPRRSSGAGVRHNRECGLFLDAGRSPDPRPRVRAR